MKINRKKATFGACIELMTCAILYHGMFRRKTLGGYAGSFPILYVSREFFIDNIVVEGWIMTEKTRRNRAVENTMFNDYPDVLSAEQLCEALNISLATVYILLREGRIHSLKVGRAYRIPKFSLIDFLSEAT